MTPLQKLSLFPLVLAAWSCRSLEFQNVSIVDQGMDVETQSYRMQLQFELYDGRGLPVQADDHPMFLVVEDGIPCTSESIRIVEQQRIFRPVVLLLDTSESMSESLPTLRESAFGFAARLRDQGFDDPRIYRFARTVTEIEDADSVEAAFLERPDERWTALYFAVQEVIQQNPESIIVVFSDGADNYSQNFGVSGVEAVEGRIEADGIQIHAIGCGAVGDERDRNGLNGARALRRIARNGTYQYVESVDDLDEVFDHIADRLRNIISLEYYSPNLSGTHELVLRAKRGHGRGKSEPLTFQAGPDR